MMLTSISLVTVCGYSHNLVANRWCQALIHSTVNFIVKQRNSISTDSNVDMTIEQTSLSFNPTTHFAMKKFATTLNNVNHCVRHKQQSPAIYRTTALSEESKFVCHLNTKEYMRIEWHLPLVYSAIPFILKCK